MYYWLKEAWLQLQLSECGFQTHFTVNSGNPSVPLPACFFGLLLNNRINVSKKKSCLHYDGWSPLLQRSGPCRSERLSHSLVQPPQLCRDLQALWFTSSNRYRRKTEVRGRLEGGFLNPVQPKVLVRRASWFEGNNRVWCCEVSRKVKRT